MYLDSEYLLLPRISTVLGHPVSGYLDLCGSAQQRFTLRLSLRLSLQYSIFVGIVPVHTAGGVGPRKNMIPIHTYLVPVGFQNMRDGVTLSARPVLNTFTRKYFVWIES